MKSIIIAFLATILLVACYKAPTREVAEARSALREALLVQANVYAPGEYTSAEDLLNLAHDEIGEDEFECAKMHAINARDVAFLARTVAMNNKAKQEAVAQTSPKEEVAPTESNPRIKEMNSSEAGEGGISETSGDDGNGMEESESLATVEDSGIADSASDAKLKESVPSDSGEGGVVVTATPPVVETQTSAEWFKLLSVYFDFDASEVKDIEKEKLIENAKWLMQNAKDKNIIVEGNCDERGSSEYNLALGAKRAASLKQFLEEFGLNKDNIQTVSFGEEKPVHIGNGDKIWTKNRRGDFRIKDK